MGQFFNSIDSPPLSLDDVKKHLRIATTDGETAITDDDDLLTAILAAACDHVERYTGRQYRNGQITLTLNAFPDGDDPIVCPRPPLRDVVSINYVDTDGQNQSYTGFQTDLASIPGLIVPPVGESWPATRNQLQAVTLVLDVGSSDVPAVVLHAMKLFCESEYEQLESAQAERIQKRVKSLVSGLVVRDERTAR